MASGPGYDSALKIAAGEFTKEQRRRLEALTAARALAANRETRDWLAMAIYISDGRRETA